MGKYGNINSGITTTEKRLPIIPLVNNYYARKKNPTDSSTTYLRTETSRMNEKKFDSRITMKREGITSFVYWR